MVSSSHFAAFDHSFGVWCCGIFFHLFLYKTLGLSGLVICFGAHWPFWGRIIPLVHHYMELQIWNGGYTTHSPPVGVYRSGVGRILQ